MIGELISTTQTKTIVVVAIVWMVVVAVGTRTVRCVIVPGTAANHAKRTFQSTRPLEPGSQ